MQRKWVVVAFADILGFGTWRRRASTTPEVAEPFIQKFYDEIGAFVKANECLYLKYLGDGFMIIKELPTHGHRCRHVGAFLHQAGELTNRISHIVKKCDWPSPEGFRTRIVAGHVSKLEVTDPNDRKRKIPEYVGYAVNLAQRLLEIAPSTPLLCHESVIKILGPHRRPFKFKRMENPKQLPRGVDPEDLAGLYSFRCVDKNKTHD